jgi:hypothetical protein
VAYDLTFMAEGRRRDLVMRGVVAPTDRVLAVMEASISLSGSFGLAPGEDCPMATIAIDTPKEPDERTADFADDCSFHLENLPSVGSIRLRASGEGWHFDVPVALPEHGDPPFLCLRPPCRERRT